MSLHNCLRRPSVAGAYPCRRTILSAAALLAGSLFASGCAGDDESGSAASGSTQQASTAPYELQEDAADDAAEEQDVELVPADFDGLPSSSEIQGFSLAGRSDPDLSSSTVNAIQEALDQVLAWGDAGFALVDLSSGRGVCSNVDEPIYGASSFKLPYALYICETQIETGAIDLETGADVFPPDASIPVDETSSWAVASSHPVMQLIEAALTQSDNDAYGILRNNFDMEGFDDWVTDLGADDCVYRADSWYPWYCVRSSLKLWCEALSYFDAGTDAALWLSDLAGSTEASFIRDALAQTGATVRNKAGWIAYDDPAYCAVVDAGIIEVDGTTYLMSIMTGMPDSTEARERFGALASAVFEARDALA